VIVFDVNETLLDMASLDGTFATIFGGADASEIRTRWFKQVLELFLTATVVGEYRSFDRLTDDALRMLAAQLGRDVTDDERDTLRRALGDLPAHRDVIAGLRRLKAGGFTLAALTNSRREAAEKVLDRAGLREQFDRVLSADDVQRYKPAREAYEHAAHELGVGLDQIVLVAAHSWDVAGALAAGCRAAFVARPGQALSAGVPEPHFRGRDIGAIADQIVTSEGWPTGEPDWPGVSRPDEIPRN
jgi:2-haloacid dehalogenase